MDTSKTLQHELQQLFAKAKMPSSPELASRILELAEDPDSTVDQFADIIQMDPALAARLLSMTNSAAFGQRREVTTIQRAISLLGINRVRTVSLGFQLVGHLGRLGGCPFDMKKFWQHSLLRACLGREFAAACVPSCADEAFLIGLLQDCGRILLVQLLGKDYAALCGDETLTPTAYFAAENRSYPYNHAEAAAVLTREWTLPEVMVTNVEQHHIQPPLSPTPADADRLRSVTYLIGSVRLSSAGNIDADEPALCEFAEQHLGMGAEAVQDAISAAGAAYAQMAAVLQGAVPEDLDVADLLSQANAHLTMTVESERSQSSQEHAQLKDALGEYRERAALDPLTRILNRGALNDALRDSFQQAGQSDKPVAMLFLDLDNFKKLNDNFGHHTGDEVLKGVAKTLQEVVPNAGFVGRYGGEEFLLAATGLAETDARNFANQVVAAVRETPFPELGLSGPVTCSLGIAWGIPEVTVDPQHFVRAADELMYQAKKSGKDRCCFRVMDSVHDVDGMESLENAPNACATTPAQLLRKP